MIKLNRFLILGDRVGKSVFDTEILQHLTRPGYGVSSPARMFDTGGRRAITAGLIGGVLFFIVAIIVSVCTVKICNRRKRRKQEQGEFRVAFRLAWLVLRRQVAIAG